MWYYVVITRSFKHVRESKMASAMFYCLLDLSCIFFCIDLFVLYVACLTMVCMYAMPRPTDPVKRVCYADDLTMWVSEVNILDLEVSLNSYLYEITAYLKDTSLLISAPKSAVTLLTPDTQQAKTHPSILIEV